MKTFTRHAAAASVARLALTLAFASAAVAGCGGGDSGGDAAKDSGGGGGKVDIAYVQGQVDKYKAVPDFKAPGPEIDQSKVKGKTVFNIPDSSANPFAAGVADSMKEAADILGMNFIDCESQGRVSQWVQCMGQARGRKADVINNFGGVDPRVIGPQIAAAQRSGIDVVSTHVYDASQKPLAVDHSVPAPYNEAAKLVADWVILDTKGKAEVLVLTSDEVTGTPPILAGLTSEFKQYCGGGCKMTKINVPVADWATKIQTEVQSALLRNPKINYVIPIYDSMSQFVVPAIRTANKIGKVHIATYNGTPFVLGYMQKDDIVRFNVGENVRGLGWAYMDANARVAAGMDVPKIIDEHTALRVFTRDNVKEAGVPPKLSTGYGSAYVDGYKGLWGVE